MARRESWTSQVGFVMSCIGSAVGLANIWRFPFAVGQNGGSAFVFVYLLCLMVVGFPVLIAEISIGRSCQANPYRVFHRVGGKRPGWVCFGMVVIINAFIITSYYSAVAGWILGYLGQALQGHLSDFTSFSQTARFYDRLVQDPWWCAWVHGSFMLLCGGLLLYGVRRGIEFANRWLMPAFLLVLLAIVAHGLSLPGAQEGLDFLFAFRVEDITPSVVLAALGHSFFTLSVGQGTMIAYGSYLSKDSNIIGGTIPIAAVDTLVSLLAAIAVFTLVFSVGMAPDAGPSLIFQTLPLVFSQIPLGAPIAVLFFTMVTFAAMTSQMSVMEPVIAYLVEERGMSRRAAVVALVGCGFVCGLPVALSSSSLSEWGIFGLDFFEAYDDLTQRVLIPLCGLASLMLVGWRFGIGRLLDHIALGAPRRLGWPVRWYLLSSIRFVAPLVVFVIFLNSLGVLG